VRTTKTVADADCIRIADVAACHQQQSRWPFDDGRRIQDIVSGFDERDVDRAQIA
jgi:hypothetical protein